MTGWSTYVDGTLESGTWVLATPKEVQIFTKEGLTRTGDPRFHRLIRLLQKLPAAFDVVAFEDVQFSSYTYQTQLWSALRCAVWHVFSRDPRVEVRAVPVGTLKKYATNHGGATKKMMAAWLLKKHPTRYAVNTNRPKRCLLKTASGRPMDDNEIDALHLMDLIRQQ